MDTHLAAVSRLHATRLHTAPRRVPITAAAAAAVALCLAAPDRASADPFSYVLCDGTEEDCPIIPIDPTLPPPELGVPFADPIFHTEIVQFTNSSVTGEPLNVPHYATFPMENADHTLVLVHHRVFDAVTLQVVRELPLNTDPVTGQGEASRPPEALWDRSDPNILRYRVNAKLVEYDFAADSHTVIHDFAVEYPNADAVYNATKGESSRDGCKWAFQVAAQWTPQDGVQVIDFIVYDRCEDSLVSLRSSPGGLPEGSPCPAPDAVDVPICPYDAKWVGLSPSGRWFIMKNTGGSHFIMPSDFSAPRVFLTQNSHSDFAYDTNGDEVLVSAFDLYQGRGMGFGMTYLDDPGTRVALIQSPGEERFGFHVSGHAYDKPGFALLSMYQSADGSDPRPQPNWMTYSHVLVELNPDKCYDCAERPVIWRVAQTFSDSGGPPGQDYWNQSWGTLTVDGSAFYWGANWFDATAPLNLYRANLPATWFEDLGGVLPPPGGEGGSGSAAGGGSGGSDSGGPPGGAAASGDTADELSADEGCSCSAAGSQRPARYSAFGLLLLGLLWVGRASRRRPASERQGAAR